MPPQIATKRLHQSLLSTASSVSPRCQCLRPLETRKFSVTAQRDTRQRRQMFRWLNGPGAVFENSLPGSTNYLSAYDANGRLIRTSNKQRLVRDGSENAMVGAARPEGVDEGKMNYASGEPIPRETAEDMVPFPMNKQFKSQSVLSEDLKEDIWRKVSLQGRTVRAVSAEMGVEMSRVGAVVRLLSVEKKWVEQGIPLATPYAKAVLAMLPQTSFTSVEHPHEPINDLPVHRDTLRQVFLPVSESRHFTREDAGSVFSPGLLPADDRVPHPELIELERLKRTPLSRQEIKAKEDEMMEAEILSSAEKEARIRENKERRIHKIAPEGSRWEYRFQDIRVEDVGRNGRDPKGVGARYGIPHQDRKRGQIKIPRLVK